MRDSVKFTYTSYFWSKGSVTTGFNALLIGERIGAIKARKIYNHMFSEATILVGFTQAQKFKNRIGSSEMFRDKPHMARYRNSETGQFIHKYKV